MNNVRIECDTNDQLQEENDSDEDYYDDEGPPPVVLVVKTSNIPNAGQGLFLASPRFVTAGTVLVEEEAIAIQRPAAKKIMNLAAWKGLQPVIQGSKSNRYLDIRNLTIYKANHCESTSTKCNACVEQCGPNRLLMTAKRNIYKNEEILWEYSKTMHEILLT